MLDCISRTPTTLRVIKIVVLIEIIQMGIGLQDMSHGIGMTSPVRAAYGLLTTEISEKLIGSGVKFCLLLVQEFRLVTLAGPHSPCKVIVFDVSASHFKDINVALLNAFVIC
jgi:hypothetical protein